MRQESKDRKSKHGLTGERRSSSKSRSSVKISSEKVKARLGNHASSYKLEKDKKLTSGPRSECRYSDSTHVGKQKHSENTRKVMALKPGAHGAPGNYETNAVKPTGVRSDREVIFDQASAKMKSRFGAEWKLASVDDFQRMLSVSMDIPQNNVDEDEICTTRTVPLSLDGRVNNTDHGQMTPAPVTVSSQHISGGDGAKEARPDSVSRLTELNNRAYVGNLSMKDHQELTNDPGIFTVYGSNFKSKIPLRTSNEGSFGDSLDFTKGIHLQEEFVNQRKQMKRARDLLNIIELEFDEQRDIFELKPLDEYSSYMLRFGQSGHNQVQIQTNEDAVSKECQFGHDGGFSTSWTQAPPSVEDGYAGQESGTWEKGSADLNRQPVDELSEAVAAETFPDIAASYAANEPNSLNLSCFCCSTLDRLKISMDIVLTIMKEEETHSLELTRLCQSTSSSDAPSAIGVVRGSLGHMCLSLQSSESTNEVTDTATIPDHCYNDMADLECVSCEFSQSSNGRLLTMHRLRENKRRVILGLDKTTHPSDMICVWAVSGASGQGRVDRILKCPGLLPMSGRAIEQLNSLSEDGDGILCVATESVCNSDIIVGGMSDGSLALWNLSSKFVPQFNLNFVEQLQALSSVEKRTSKEFEITPSQTIKFPLIFNYAQPPDYLASAVFAGKASQLSDCGHINQATWDLSAPVIAIKILKSQEFSSNATSHTALNSFQLCSLDARSLIRVWLVLVQKHDTITGSGSGANTLSSIAGSITELGLRPCSSTRIIHLTQLQAGVPRPLEIMGSGIHRRFISSVSSSDSSSANLDGRPFALCLEVCNESGVFFVGGEDGKIRQCSQVANRCLHPTFFHSQGQAGVLFFPDSAVTCLAMHPVQRNLLLAGYMDGRLALFLTYRQTPLFEWQAGIGRNQGQSADIDTKHYAIKKATWSTHRPTVVYSMTSSGEIAAWVIIQGSKNALQPLLTFNPLAQTLIAGMPETSVTDGHRVVDFTIVDGVGSGCLAICWADGAEVHWLEDHLTVAQTDELILLRAILDALG